MPIEILPEGYPDWVLFDSLSDIKFLGLDPFWKTKTGSVKPNDAILYRGGLGYLERSTDGGRTWSDITPADNPSWFWDSEWELDLWGGNWGCQPVPGPYDSNGDPVAAPGPNELVYAAYSPNWSHIDEHYILCYYNGVDELATDLDLNVVWVLYTLDDWATHEWFKLVDVYHSLDNYASVTPGSSTSIATATGSTQFDAEMIKISSAKVAAFWTTAADGDSGHHLSESGGAFTNQGSASGVWTKPLFLEDGTSNVWCGYIKEYADAGGAGIDRFKAVAVKWDFSGAGAPSVTEYESTWLPDFSSEGENTFALTFRPSHLTENGKMIWVYGCYDNPIGTDEYRKWCKFYYDVKSNTWSSYYETYNDDDENTPSYVALAAVTIDGGDKMAVIEAEVWSYINGPPATYKAWSYIQNAGAWANKIDSDLFTTSNFSVDSTLCKKLSDNRVVMKSRVYRYDLQAAPNTLTFLESDSDYCDSMSGLRKIGYARDCDTSASNLIAATNDYLAYSDPDTYPADTIRISDALTNCYCSLTDFSTYARLYFSFPDVYADIVTIGTRGSDWLAGHGYAGRLACSLNGQFIFVPSWRYDGDEFYFRTQWDQIERNASTGKLEYNSTCPAGFDTISQSELIAEVPDAPLSFVPWADETDGALIFGVPYYGYSVPDQIWGYSETAGWTYYLGGIYSNSPYPVRAIVTISGDIHAILETPSGLELWVYNPGGSSGAWLTKVANITELDAAIQGDTMDVDTVDYALVVVGIANPGNEMVMVSLPPYTSWNNLTLSHTSAYSITGVIVIN